MREATQQPSNKSTSTAMGLCWQFLASPGEAEPFRGRRLTLTADAGKAQQVQACGPHRARCVLLFGPRQIHRESQTRHRHSLRVSAQSHRFIRKIARRILPRSSEGGEENVPDVPSATAPRIASVSACQRHRHRNALQLHHLRDSPHQHQRDMIARLEGHERSNPLASEEWRRPAHRRATMSKSSGKT